jgi:hypothetical protein
MNFVLQKINLPPPLSFHFPNNDMITLKLDKSWFNQRWKKISKSLQFCNVFMLSNRLTKKWILFLLYHVIEMMFWLPLTWEPSGTISHVNSSLPSFYLPPALRSQMDDFIPFQSSLVFILATSLSISCDTCPSFVFSSSMELQNAASCYAPWKIVFFCLIMISTIKS